MAVQLPLPEPGGLPSVVIFHREHPSEPILTLQVPSPGADDSETYVVRLDRPKDKAWFNALPGAKDLLYLLGMEMHVAYKPESGVATPLRDLDEPPPFAEDFQDARDKVARPERWDRHFQRRQRRMPAMSRFRMSLLGRSHHRPGYGNAYPPPGRGGAR